MDVLKVLGIVVFGNALVWTLFFWQRRRQMDRVRAVIERSGETWIIAPEKSFFQGFAGPVSVKTMGAIGLTENNLMFIPPLGRNMVYPLKDVVELSQNAWFHGNYRNGREFLILKLAGGKEVGFQVGDIQRWTEEIRNRMPSG